MTLCLAPIDQQKTLQQPTSGDYAISNGFPVPSTNESNEMGNFHAKQRLTQSTPGSPQDHGRPTSIEVVGSAESLVGRVRMSIISVEFCFNTKCFLIWTGSCGAGTRKILWSRFHTIYIAWNARSFKYDQRRNGYGRASTYATKSHAKFLNSSCSWKQI